MRGIFGIKALRIKNRSLPAAIIRSNCNPFIVFQYSNANKKNKEKKPVELLTNLLSEPKVQST